jgi:Na+-driven multidrug efflux pump
MFSTFTLKTGFRAIGDMKLLLQVSALTAGLNFLLDPVMIFERVYIGPWPMLGIHEPLLSFPGAGLGIAGAAWGTVFAFAFVFIQSFWIFTTGRTFLRMRPRDFFGLSLATSWKIVRIGAPPAAANTMQNVANLFVGSAINTYGVAVFAGQGVNQMLSRLIRMMVFGINMSGITIVGQNLGAGNPQRAERATKYALLATAAIMLLIGVLGYLAAPAVARLFIPGTDADSLAAAGWTVRILRINCFVFLPFALSRIARIAFEGSGYTKPTMYAVAATTWGLQLPATLAGVYWLKLPNPDFVWWIEAGAYTVCTVILYLVMQKGQWKRVVL